MSVACHDGQVLSVDLVWKAAIELRSKGANIEIVAAQAAVGGWAAVRRRDGLWVPSRVPTPGAALGEVLNWMVIKMAVAVGSSTFLLLCRNRSQYHPYRFFSHTHNPFSFPTTR